MKKKILVTGGTGFLGKHIVNFYKKNTQYGVFSCSRTEGIDLRNYKKFSKYLKKITPDIVIHCAAHVGGIQYDEIHPIEVLEDNTLISINVVKAVAKCGVKTLIDVMPNCTYPAKYNVYKEENWWNGELHPSVLVYGFPRKMLYVSAFAYLKKYEFKIIHAILPNLYGPGDHFDPIKSHALGALISKIVKAKKNNEKIVEIWGTGKPIREWLYVEDAVTAINEVSLNIDNILNNDILNIGTNTGISVIDLANKIKDIVNWQGKFILNTDKQDGAMKKKLADEKMKKFIDWKPSYTFEEGLTKTIQNYMGK